MSWHEPIILIGPNSILKTYRVFMLKPATNIPMNIVEHNLFDLLSRKCPPSDFYGNFPKGK